MSHAPNTRPAIILLVEDNDDEVFLTRRAFRDCAPLLNLQHVDNGASCMAFLRKQAPYEQAPTPDLILLDLNMPIMDGREVLKAIGADPALCHLPVVVLTTSAEQADVLATYRLGCNSYVAKPVNFDKFALLVRQLVEYWFTLASLPNNHN